MKKVKVDIEGMTCNNCEKHVEEELKKVGAKKAKANHVEKNATFFVKEFSEEKTKEAVKSAGYKPKKIYVKEEKGLLGGLFK